jgi:hypothetical protein
MDEPMTPEELSAIEARLEAATAGPWWRTTDATVVWGGNGASGHERVATVGSWRAEADANFIVHAPGDVARLLVEVRRMRAADKLGLYAMERNMAQDEHTIRELRAEVARLKSELDAAARAYQAASLREERLRAPSEPHATPLELLQPETPVEQANVEPARPVRLAKSGGWENPDGTDWWFFRVAGMRARVFPVNSGFGWDIPPALTGTAWTLGGSDYPTFEAAQRAAEQWLRDNGGGA